MDYRLVQAMNEIRGSYNDVVDVVSKAKSLHKFGRNPDVSTSFETIWEYGGDETYVTTNAIDKLSSSATADTAVTVTIEGHTVSGTGTDSQFTFVIQTANVNGRNKVTLGTPLARVSRVYVSSGTLVGDLYIYEDDTLTLGVPDTASKVHINVVGTGGNQQSFKAATTFSNTDYFICTGGWAAVNRNAAAIDADFELQVRTPGGVFRPAGARLSCASAGSSTVVISFDPFVIVPKNADIRVRAVASATSELHAQFSGYLAQVVS